MRTIGRRSAVLTAFLTSVLTLLGAATAPAQAQPSVVAAGGTFTFSGHGWGHGRGMGQYGALGYAVNFGWTYEQILDHYYGGTAMGQVSDPPISVELTGLTGKAVVVTGTGLLINGKAANSPALRLELVGGSVTVTAMPSCAGTPGTVVGTYALGIKVTTSASDSPSPTLSQLPRVCETSDERAYRGALTVQAYAGKQTTFNVVSVEDYLKGVVPRESPAYWGTLGGGAGMQALDAQAVAARSYALASSRPSGADVCDSTSCQVYQGAATTTDHGATFLPLEYAATDQAVADTTGMVRVRSTAPTIPVSTEFSSSTGGWTAGGAFPAVEDLGDAIAANPNHTWSTTIDAVTIASDLGVPGPVQSVTVTQRNGFGDWGGRVVQVTVTDGAGSAHTYTGGFLSGRLGLKSDWFSVSSFTSLEAQKVVQALYEDVLGRPADPAGLAWWTDNVVARGNALTAVSGMVNSPERLRNLVTDQYQAALNRKPEPAGLANWVNYLASGKGVYELEIRIYGSPESLNTLGGGNVGTWVGAMYTSLLGRSASAADQVFWTNYATAHGRAAAVAGIAQSPEASMRRLTVYYETFLKRGVDPSGMRTWLPLMTARGDFTVPVALGNSAEYWIKAQSRP